MEIMLTTVHPSSQLCFPSNIILNPSIASSILLIGYAQQPLVSTKLKMHKFATSHLGPEIFLPEFRPWVLLWSTLATWEHKESRPQILLHINIVKLRRGLGKDRKGMALKAKGLKAWSLAKRDVCRVTIGHLRVTIGHLRVTIGHLGVTIGYFFL